MTASFTVVRAAAGCGKTTDLACRYLRILAEGVPAEQAIAITFTRRAAAELEERVALALRACLDDGGPSAAEARARLGSAWPRYAEAAPGDPAIVREALAALPDAPIGTTDAFVQRLLTEHALDAALPVPDGRVPLDLPITPRAGVARALRRAARRVLDPPDGTVDPHVALLARYLSLDELLEQLARRTKWDDLPLAGTAEVIGTFARGCAEALLPLGLATSLGVADPGLPEAWEAALEKLTNTGSRWAIPAVAAWFARGGLPDEAPFELCGWLVGVHKGRARAIVNALSDTVRDCGPGKLTLWEIVQALRYPYDDPAQVALADELRAARDQLRRRVDALGLREAALAGELDYDALLSAAIALCEAPPPRLAGRYRALLVDEIQDANPAQLKLYRALAAHEGMRTYFVGDARQSIYLFRDAEPEGIRELDAEARRAGTTEELTVNRRSAPLLVHAHRELFARLDRPMRAQRWRPPDDLARLEPDPANASLALDPAHHQPDAPVWIVLDEEHRCKEHELDDRVLRAFLDRVEAAWREPGHAGDTAVVLTPTWALAHEACARIRAWTGRASGAFVEGGAGRRDSRVGEDVATWLRALTDPSDEVAWVGVWKHPAVGLSDAALARAARGAGLSRDGAEGPEPAPGWCRRPPYLADVDRLLSPHDEADVLAFARARDPIREARGRIGRTSTAAVLDQLWTALGWRAVLAAGPGGPDEVAELEVLLDRIRDLDADGQPPDAILASLEDDAVERPQVHVARPAGHVVCTTVFQAKGLAWDHVCVLRIGRHARRDSARDVNEGWIQLGERRVRLEGLRFDPHGGLSPFRDPLARLAGALYAHREAEECARLAYVAITRARRSVTFGLGRFKRPQGRTSADLVELLGEAWLGDDAIAGVARVPRPAVPPPGPPVPGWTRPTGLAWPAPSERGPAWDERAPSSLGAHLDVEARLRHAENVAMRVRLGNGLHLGGGRVDPPAADFPQLGPADWGTVAHGWFAEWRFRGEADPAAIDRWLAAEWGGGAPAVRDWLVALCRRLAEVGGPVWALVTDPACRLHFEHPLLGLGAQQDRDVLLSGRMDLLVERPRGRLAVVDFKAGEKAPTGWDDLVDAASLRTYAFQLEAYAEALRRMGRVVDTVALWFVRTGTSVRWTP